MHESMTDLRKLVAETHVQRPKTDIGGMIDGLNLQTGEVDGREEQGIPHLHVYYTVYESDRDVCQNFLKEL